MQGMSHDACNFNKPLNIWNVLSVIQITHAFDNADYFNQPLDDWDVHMQF